jgi:hypothetical protein
LYTSTKYQIKEREMVRAYDIYRGEVNAGFSVEKPEGNRPL